MVEWIRSRSLEVGRDLAIYIGVRTYIPTFKKRRQSILDVSSPKSRYLNLFKYVSGIKSPLYLFN